MIPLPRRGGERPGALAGQVRCSVLLWLSCACCAQHRGAHATQYGCRLASMQAPGLACLCAAQSTFLAWIHLQPAGCAQAEHLHTPGCPARALCRLAGPAERPRTALHEHATCLRSCAWRPHCALLQVTSPSMRSSRSRACQGRPAGPLPDAGRRCCCWACCWRRLQHSSQAQRIWWTLPNGWPTPGWGRGQVCKFRCQHLNPLHAGASSHRPARTTVAGSACPAKPSRWCTACRPCPRGSSRAAAARRLQPGAAHASACAACRLGRGRRRLAGRQQPAHLGLHLLQAGSFPRLLVPGRLWALGAAAAGAPVPHAGLSMARPALPCACAPACCSRAGVPGWHAAMHAEQRAGCMLLARAHSILPAAQSGQTPLTPGERRAATVPRGLPCAMQQCLRLACGRPCSPAGFADVQAHGVAGLGRPEPVPFACLCRLTSPALRERCCGWASHTWRWAQPGWRCRGAGWCATWRHTQGRHAQPWLRPAWQCTPSASEHAVRLTRGLSGS